MSTEGEHAPSNRLPADAQYAWLGFYFGVHFHQPIKLTSKDGHALAAEFNKHWEIDQVNLKSDTWTFVSSREGFRIVITEGQLELHSDLPGQKQERYDVHFQTVLCCFEQQFHPQIILGSKAMVCGLLDIDGDARTFLAQSVLRVSQTRLDPLTRPIHLLGLRIYFPAYEVAGGGEGKKGSDWDVDVRLESYMSDPRKLFVRADATWKEPKPWDTKSIEEVVGRLSVVSDYVGLEIRRFLEHENHTQ